MLAAYATREASTFIISSLEGGIAARRRFDERKRNTGNRTGGWEYSTNERQYLLKIRLLEIEPEIWRLIVVQGGTTLDRPYDVIQIVLALWSELEPDLDELESILRRGRTKTYAHEVDCLIGKL
jgi:hypothetical protein